MPTELLTPEAESVLEMFKRNKDTEINVLLFFLSPNQTLSEVSDIFDKRF